MSPLFEAYGCRPQAIQLGDRTPKLGRARERGSLGPVVGAPPSQHYTERRGTSPVYINPVPNMCLCIIKMHMALRRCAKLAPVGAAALQSARRLGARSRGTAEEAPDALIRRLGREILHHVPVATHVSELGQLVGMLCSSVHACAPCYASRISYL